MGIAIALVVGLIIGSIITGVAKTDIKEIPCQHWDYDFKASKLSTLETKVYFLERENESLNYLFQSLERNKRYFHEQFAAHCGICHKTFYSKDMKGQEVADMLKNITLTSEEIAKKLDIKIC